MEIPQLETTNVFLGIVAGLAVVQMIVLITAAIWLRSTFGRLSQAAVTFESQRLGPMVGEVRQLANQAQQLITEVQSTVHRAHTLVNGIEHRTRRAMATVDAVNERVDAVVNTGWNEVYALKSGLRRGISALVRSARRRS
jgi:hypothetical protein